MKKQEFVVNKNKKIFVFDDVFELEQRNNFYNIISSQVMFRIGFQDQNVIENKKYQYLHSEWSEEEASKFGILKNLNIKDHKDILELIDNTNFSRAIVNLTLPGDTYFVHTHPGLTALYYCNLHWKEEYAGETLFFNEDVSEIIYASMYKPGRLIIFDGTIPHTIRPQSSSAPSYRFTYTTFLQTI